MRLFYCLHSLYKEEKRNFCLKNKNFLQYKNKIILMLFSNK